MTLSRYEAAILETIRQYGIDGVNLFVTIDKWADKVAVQKLERAGYITINKSSATIWYCRIKENI